jgi:uncharacterized phage infection (PIP) family protein YhgE
VDDYQAAMSRTKQERDASLQQAEKLKEVSMQSSKTSSQLKSQLSDCNNRIAALETALTHTQQQLKESIDTASRAEIEHKQASKSLTEEMKQLHVITKNKIEEIRADATTRVEAAEARWRREAELTRKADSEVETMKVNRLICLLLS